MTGQYAVTHSPSSKSIPAYNAAIGTVLSSIAQYTWPLLIVPPGRSKCRISSSLNLIGRGCANLFARFTTCGYSDNVPSSPPPAASLASPLLLPRPLILPPLLFSYSFSSSPSSPVPLTLFSSCSFSSSPATTIENSRMVPCTAIISTWPGPVLSSRVENACRMSSLPPSPIDVRVYFDVILSEAVIDNKW
jgi:hypothetical protein